MKFPQYFSTIFLLKGSSLFVLLGLESQKLQMVTHLKAMQAKHRVPGRTLRIKHKLAGLCPLHVISIFRTQIKGTIHNTQLTIIWIHLTPKQHSAFPLQQKRHHVLMYVNVCMWKNIYVYTHYQENVNTVFQSPAIQPLNSPNQTPDKPPEDSWLQLKLGAPLWRALRSWGNTYTSWLHLAPLWDKDHHHQKWLWLPYKYIYIISSLRQTEGQEETWTFHLDMVTKIYLIRSFALIYPKRSSSIKEKGTHQKIQSVLYKQTVDLNLQPTKSQFQNCSPSKSHLFFFSALAGLLGLNTRRAHRFPASRCYWEVAQWATHWTPETVGVGVVGFCVGCVLLSGVEPIKVLVCVV